VKGWSIQPILEFDVFVVSTKGLASLIFNSPVAVNVQSSQNSSFTTTKWFNGNSPGWNPGIADTIYHNPGRVEFCVLNYYQPLNVIEPLLRVGHH